MLAQLGEMLGQILGQIFGQILGKMLGKMLGQMLGKICCMQYAGPNLYLLTFVNTWLMLGLCLAIAWP